MSKFRYKVTIPYNEVGDFSNVAWWCSDNFKDSQWKGDLIQDENSYKMEFLFSSREVFTRFSLRWT